jgi:hypothetical protein
MSPTTEYVDFHLVDPEILAKRGLEKAIVLTISGLMRSVESSIALSFLPEWSQTIIVNRNLLKLAHGVLSRKMLADSATKIGAWQCFYCSRCGGRLERTCCEICERRYPASKGQRVIGWAPIIPEKVVRYAQKCGHQFEQAPPRS